MSIEKGCIRLLWLNDIPNGEPALSFMELWKRRACFRFYRYSQLFSVQDHRSERMDGKSILKYFDNRIAAEIRLPEAIDRKAAGGLTAEICDWIKISLLFFHAAIYNIVMEAGMIKNLCQKKKTYMKQNALTIFSQKCRGDHGCHSRLSEMTSPR